MVVASKGALHKVEPGYKLHDHGLRFSDCYLMSVVKYDDTSKAETDALQIK